MAYTIRAIHNGKSTDITKRCGNLVWTDSEDSLGLEFSFDMPYSYSDENFKKKLYCGDTIIVKSGTNEVVRGVITETPVNGDTYKGYDYAFYLNKSECIVQFKGIAADKAIKQLCNRYSVPIGNIAKMSTIIKKVYKDVTVYDVIKDIISQVKTETGDSHRVEMKNGKFYILQSGSIKITPTYIDKLGRKIYCTKSASITGTESIEELRNKVIYAGTGEDKKEIKATAKDSKSIAKYGLLTDVETADNLTSAKAKNKAKNKLKSLNKVKKTFTAEMIGSYIVRAGRLIYFERPEAGLNGWYKVKSVTHTVNNGIHTMSCEMERV